MNLLIAESPLLILPTLAQNIGLEEAVLLQQLHFRLTHQGKERDGKIWYCQAYANWAEQFPFWSESKIKRIFLKLEKLGIIQSTSKYNSFYVDRTKWYTIDYHAFEALCSAHENENQTTIVHPQTMPASTGEPSQRAQSERSKRKDFKDVLKEREEKEAQAHPSLFEQSKQAETINTNAQQEVHVNNSLDTQIDQIIQYLNNKTGKRFNPKTAANRKLIQARLQDGYTAQDCYLVIDNQVSLWLNESKMRPYLRPQTLFRASNFDSYLNNSAKQQELVFRQPIQVELDFEDH